MTSLTTGETPAGIHPIPAAARVPRALAAGSLTFHDSEPVPAPAGDGEVNPAWRLALTTTSHRLPNPWGRSAKWASRPNRKSRVTENEECREIVLDLESSYKSCSALTRVTACTPALSPFRGTLTREPEASVTSLLPRLLQAGEWRLELEHTLAGAAFARHTLQAVVRMRPYGGLSRGRPSRPSVPAVRHITAST
jgi:hypothetical protein